MADLLARIEHQILTRGLLAPRQKVLVAVSGGLDSMVLLHLLRTLAVEQGWGLSVAHFNHHLRGAASEADHRLVRLVAERAGLPFFAGDAFVKKLAKQEHISIEMAARKARHEFLAVIARREKISTVALAHHADDQVEHFFLRLFRGGGGEALGGMKWRSPSPGDSRITLVRPLLDCRKAELQVFADQHKISFRKDASNDLVAIPRNKVRRELLPWLRKHYQSEIDRRVLRAMDIIGAEAEALAELAGHWLMDPQAPFDRLAVAIQRRVIQLQLHQMQVAADFEQIEQLRLSPDSAINVTGNLFIFRTGEGRLKEMKPAGKAFNPDRREVQLEGRKGTEIFAGREFTWSLCRYQPAISLKKRGQVEQFDAERVGGEICLRHWQAGDRFRPIGMPGAVKLQDLFTNAKVLREGRHERVVAEGADGRIFWVEGLRLGEECKVTSETKWILNWRWAKRPLK